MNTNIIKLLMVNSKNIHFMMHIYNLKILW